MTTPTYATFKVEQTEIERRGFLARLLSVEKLAETYVAGRQTIVTDLENEIAELQEQLVKAKANSAEIAQNRDAFIATVAELADKPVILFTDVTQIEKDVYKVNTTAEQREKNKSVNVQMLNQRYSYDIYEELRDMGLHPSMKINLVKGR